MRKRSREEWMAAAINTVRYRHFKISDEPFDLTLEYMLDLWIQQNGCCAYSGLPMHEPQYKTGRDLESASIDRINPKRGYLRDNVKWVTWRVNWMKGGHSLREFIAMCKVIAEHNGHVLAELADALP